MLVQPSLEYLQPISVLDRFNCQEVLPSMEPNLASLSHSPTGVFPSLKLSQTPLSHANAKRVSITVKLFFVLGAHSSRKISVRSP